MKKVVRLTESDLMRIVKRVINESSNRRILNEFGPTPYAVFHDKMDNAGYVIVDADKSNKINHRFGDVDGLSGEGDGDSDYIYIRKKNDEKSQWKTITFAKGIMDNGFVSKNFEEVQNPNSKLWSIVTDSSLIRKLNTEAKAVIYASRTPYDVLSQEPTVKNIVNMLKSSKSRGVLDLGGDEEAYAEAAFMAIDSKQKYLEVKKMLGQDPYQFVKNFMDTSEVYHKKSIDSSMKRLGL